MTWFRRACDRAFNLGLSIAELTRRVHGAIKDRQMVNLAIALEEQVQADEKRKALSGVLSAIREPELSPGDIARCSAVIEIARKSAVECEQRKANEKQGRS